MALRISGVELERLAAPLRRLAVRVLAQVQLTQDEVRERQRRSEVERAPRVGETLIENPLPVRQVPMQRDRQIAGKGKLREGRREARIERGRGFEQAIRL